MFEKLDKDRFIKSYIQSQKPHATIYAADGKTVQSSWEPTATPDKQNLSARSLRDYGFDTPVLKPRVARSPEGLLISIEGAIRNGSEDEDEASLVREVSPKKPTRQTNKSTRKTKSVPVSKPQKENVALPLNKPQAKPTSKKRPVDANPDSDHDDHVARTSYC